MTLPQFALITNQVFDINTKTSTILG